jgi:hypothetical protein
MNAGLSNIGIRGAWPPRVFRGAQLLFTKVN